ncbi:CapA family protein [Natronobacterium texcoconense]|uniref:Poly-gamma-glutamate biosynthesis protein CapA/YwtB (Capsule formation), metallophosphatase superfamily n=1 Tax=Natronobacterium texcoconense TaxID=1095778 RepID=A0A1H0ZCD8_NATTX|nr:CapA family protein [Natronobacterium texcoconense]SDQ25074.1 Poly-gamma-glutamate biosynthesis protein CapA/YwtB (capsule formation), metallophosphatase superfamily [Natronobacterium texcoconense]
MDESIYRRQALAGVGAATASVIGGCSVYPRSDETDEPQRTRSVEGSVIGTVVDIDREPIEDAAIEAVRETTVLAETTTDADGRFELEADGPVWLRASHEAYLTQLGQAVPDEPIRIVLTPNAEAVSLSFGGDVMFGRRFYEENSDALSPRYEIDPARRLADHRDILSHIEPVLEHADVTSVNLETPLTTSDWRHPEKLYGFVSHPVAADALADAGVDYVALGNNHVFDALTPGLEETVSTLDSAGISYSGAGMDSDAAWEPAIVSRNGIDIAYLSCTTVTGTAYDIDWSADHGVDETHTLEDGDESLSVPGSAGVAAPTETRLSEAVESATARADVVVVQIHGGNEYQREPTPRLETLTDVAAEAGADLVVNHHPHVVGGIERRHGALVAWTLGNLVFDQELWETLRSYVLTAHVTEDGVVRASINPVLLEGYVPKGVAGRLGSVIGRETAVRSDDSILPTRTGIADTEAVSWSSETVDTTVSGTSDVYASTGSWVDSVDVLEGTVEFGRDRFVTGQFGDYVVDDQRFEGPLWRFGRDGRSAGPPLGRDEGSGLRLARHEDNVDNAILSPRLRLPIDGEELSITGVYRFDHEDGLELSISWYDDTSGGSFERDRFDLSGTGGEWDRFHHRLNRPADATYIDVYLILSPPESGSREAVFDEIRLLEWGDDEPRKDADHLRVDGEANVEFEAREDTVDDLMWEQF